MKIYNEKINKKHKKCVFIRMYLANGVFNLEIQIFDTDIVLIFKLDIQILYK